MYESTYVWCPEQSKTETKNRAAVAEGESVFSGKEIQLHKMEWLVGMSGGDSSTEV